MGDISLPKAVSKDWGGDSYFIWEDNNAKLQGTWKIKETWHHQRISSNWTQRHADWQFISKKEFKIAVLRKYSKLQEDTERQFNEIRKTIPEQNKKFSKLIEIKEKNETEILAVKNTINEMKNAIESINSRTGQAKEIIREVEDMNFEIIQSHENKEKRMKKSEESLHEL